MGSPQGNAVTSVQFVPMPGGRPGGCGMREKVWRPFILRPSPMLVGLEYAARRLPQGSLRTGLIAINKRYPRRDQPPLSGPGGMLV
jgi:hypothetical protein